MSIRPKNLNLLTISFPIPAMVSILHRISGVFLLLLIPFFLWGFENSLTPSGFATWQSWLNDFYVKWFIWLLLIPFCYHFIAGMRHLLMDIHLGTSLSSGRWSAQLTLVLTILLIILAGYWLW